MVKIENSYSKLSIAKFRSFEVRTGIILPSQYREFLFVTNGGEPIPNVATIPDVDSALVDLLYGICDIRQPGDLEFEIARKADLLPKEFIPIGHDPGGNTFLIGLVGIYSGRVYYWDSCFFFEPSNKTQNTYLVTEGFNDFLQSLR